jgi:hypothetical protein
MPSHFPRMNPWLEQPDVWHDFHQAFISSIRTALAERIRPSYIARIDENVYIHELSAEQRYLLGRPDVGVFDNAAAAKTAAATSGTSSIPIALGSLLPPTERISESFIEIRDREYRDLITVIELLSPTKKTPGPDRDLYLAKRKLLTAGNVHFVEIDLLRDGARMPVEGLTQSDYAIMVSRSYERPQVGLWPMKLREPLPSIPIPLKREDPDAIIDLQQLLHTTLDAAGYADYINLGKPRLPLHPEEEAWAAAFRN